MPGDLLRVAAVSRRQGAYGSHRVPLAGRGVQPVPRLRCDPRGGLEGIENGYELPPSRDALDPMALQEAETLPGSMLEALQDAERSELLRTCLGDHLFESLLTSKRIEWERYRSFITDYELNRYLPIL